MLKIENLTFRYSRRKPPVLDDFSMEIGNGSVVGLLGPNGAGKSTLLYLIAGALTPGAGRVLFKGKNTRKRQPSVISDIFIVPEEFSLPAVTISEFVKLNGGFYPRFSAEDLSRHLETFEIDPSQKLGSMSMGQKKKAYMCFALACNTSLLLMDEPTNGLNIPAKSTFRRFIASNMNEERTIVISTHQVRDIDKILDHVIIIDNKQVLFDRSVSDITANLRFVTTNDPALITASLFTQPNVGGANIILPNDTEAETDINLESLFGLALSNPHLLNLQFEKSKS